jgi:hypothetical protein
MGLFLSAPVWTEPDFTAPAGSPALNTTGDRAVSPNTTAVGDRSRMPGAYHVGTNTTDIDEASVWPFPDDEVGPPLAFDDPEIVAPVAAHLVDTEDEQRRLQDLEAQNRILRERESHAAIAQVLSKGEIVKSFFNLRDPEFRRQRICGVACILLTLTAIVLGLALTRDNQVPEKFAPTMPPTPEPTSVALGSLSEFLSEHASFDKGAAIVNQSTPQYQAAKWLSNNMNIDNYTDKQKIQRYVLAILYFSTNGDNWTANTGWMNDDDECETWWQSRGSNLSCTSEGEVNSIILEKNDLMGTIPLELAFLSSSLEMVHLRDNEMAGTVPAELAHLTLLKQLDLDANNLSGSIITELGQLTKLYWLGMTENEISGTIPTEIFRLTDLCK